VRPCHRQELYAGAATTSAIKHSNQVRKKYGKDDEEGPREAESVLASNDEPLLALYSHPI
jgi:hypothetical protein